MLLKRLVPTVVLLAPPQRAVERTTPRSTPARWKRRPGRRSDVCFLTLVRHHEGAPSRRRRPSLMRAHTRWRRLAAEIDEMEGLRATVRWLDSLTPGPRRARWSPREDRLRPSAQPAPEVIASGHLGLGCSSTTPAGGCVGDAAHAHSRVPPAPTVCRSARLCSTACP